MFLLLDPSEQAIIDRLTEIQYPDCKGARRILETWLQRPTSILMCHRLRDGEVAVEVLVNGSKE